MYKISKALDKTKYSIYNSNRNLIRGVDMPDIFENKIMSSLEKTSTEPIIYRYHSMYRPSLYFSLNEDEFERSFNPLEE